VQVAIDELRVLAAGVFPVVLGDFGPVAALKAAVRAAPVPTTVRGVNVACHPPEVERAIYFCCLEALQNTYKHARTATAARVRVATRGRELTFEVTDNGLGFDPAMVAPGAGLHNMHDRVAPLGGSLTIDAGPGTRITGVIPLVRSSAGTGRGDASGWTGSGRRATSRTLPTAA
jgi:signal transduction histidine kinase